VFRCIGSYALVVVIIIAAYPRFSEAASGRLRPATQLIVELGNHITSGLRLHMHSPTELAPMRGSEIRDSWSTGVFAEIGLDQARCVAGERRWLLREVWGCHRGAACHMLRGHIILL